MGFGERQPAHDAAEMATGDDDLVVLSQSISIDRRALVLLLELAALAILSSRTSSRGTLDGRRRLGGSRGRRGRRGRGSRRRRGRASGCGGTGRRGGGSRGSAGSRESGDPGAGEVVLSAAEEVAEDAGVVVAVGTGEGDELALGTSGLGAADDELGAAGVELGTLRGAGNVQGEDLVADEVVAGSEVIGELDGGEGAVHEVALEPLSVGLLAALSDLEPASVGSVELVTGDIATAGEISHLGAGVVRPVVEVGALPVEAKGVAGHDSSVSGSGPRVGAAEESGVVGATVGVLRGDGTNDIPILSGTVDGHADEDAVGRDVDCGDEGKEESEGLHCSGGWLRVDWLVESVL